MEAYNGLNGKFWNWIKRNVHIIAAAATAVGLAPIALALEAAVLADGGSQSGNVNKTNLDYEPSINESNILDPWVNNKLKPFYQTLLLEAKQAFAMSDYNAQLSAINNIKMKMCVVREYYKTRETNGLSVPALNLRNTLIDEIFLPVDEMIMNSINNLSNLTVVKYPISITNNIQFRPLDVNSFSTTCEKYDTAPGTSINTSSEPLLSVSPIVVNPVTNQVIQEPIKTEKQNNKSSLGLLFLGLLGVAMLLISDEQDELKEKKYKKKSEVEE